MGGKLTKRNILESMAQMATPMVLWQLHSTVLVLENDY